MAFLQDSAAPDDGLQASTTTQPLTTTPTEQPRSGFDWNGPMGFWIALPAAIAAVTALGLLLQ